MKDHPRRCGENLCPVECHALRLGSPPQVRGKLPIIIEALPQIRITPAGAGKTKQIFVNKFSAEDHPRRCGENLNLPPDDAAKAGSPPQVRGKLSQVLQGIGEVRITPAGAGKTAIVADVSARCQDHPRRCGENVC